MNTLQKFLTETGFSESDVLNFLQDFGMISDNVISAADVAEVDAVRSVDFLRRLAQVDFWLASPAGF